MKRVFILMLISLLFIGSAKSTTWFPQEIKCPMCGKKNTYQVIGSYGSYIYSWPSKFQFIYWPTTDEECFYCCIDCHFSCYMWDFEDFETGKKDTIKSLLENTEFDKNYKDYLEVPILKRLEIAEKVYRIIEKDDDFWCQFYRVYAYHCDNKNEKQLAKEFRLKAVALSNKMLVNKDNEGREKEFYYIIACMKYYSDEKDSSLFYLNKAKDLEYDNKNWEKDNSKNLNDYLNATIDEFILKIENKTDEK